MDYPGLLARLFSLRRFGVRPGLATVRAALAAVGDPHLGVQAIHLAGTNGKGSTAAFAESILRAAGVRTGLFTSPHLLRFTERIRLGGVELDENEAAELGARVLAAAPEATFFEVATVMAFLAFAARQVEVAVIEAGLGGRLDSTNVLEAPLATVVTGIALDHTEVLGPTLADIAREKAGIWKAGAPALCACDDEGAFAVLAAEAARVGAPLYRLGRELAPLSGVPLGLAGAHQRQNATLARAAALHAAERVGVSLDEPTIARGLLQTRWPGRLERVGDLILDAAHNPDGAHALAQALPELASGRPLALVFGVVEDKDAAAMLDALVPALPPGSQVIFTRPPSPRGRDPESLRALLSGAAPTARCEVIPEVGAALAAARRSGAQVVVAGSIFLIAEARRLVTGERADPLMAQDPPASSAKRNSRG
ncbi:MAG TPA: folylpolyglutamate synthase/dihydrofolate synthase family protein [Polyangia bacterium]